jgi:hypothetical protein
MTICAYLCYEERVSNGYNILFLRNSNLWNISIFCAVKQYHKKSVLQWELMKNRDIITMTYIITDRHKINDESYKILCEQVLKQKGKQNAIIYSLSENPVNIIYLQPKNDNVGPLSIVGPLFIYLWVLTFPL